MLRIAFQAVKKIGLDAFISVGNIMGVYGQGFDSYKAPLAQLENLHQ